jgi:hypothetical protein
MPVKLYYLISCFGMKGRGGTAEGIYQFGVGCRRGEPAATPEVISLALGLFES